MQDIVGQTFGDLFVIKRTTKKSNSKWYYLCRCVCGNEVEVRGYHLISGATKGCIKCRIEKVANAKRGKGSSLKGKELSHIPNLSGQVFNDLKVVNRVGKSKSGEWLYTCLCACGKETKVSSVDLRKGNVKRCKACGIRHMTETMRKQAADKRDRLSPYPVDFSPELKREIRKRDKYTCQLCGHRPPRIAGHGLHIHHIDSNKNNNNTMNLVGLCNRCHAKVQKNENYWIPYWQSFMQEKYGA